MTLPQENHMAADPQGNSVHLQNLKGVKLVLVPRPHQERKSGQMTLSGVVFSPVSLILADGTRLC